MFDPLKVTVMTWGLFFNDRMRTPNKTKTKKFNIAPEAWWLEDDILSYWEGNFSGANVKLRGCKKKTDTYTHLKLNIYTQKNCCCFVCHVFPFFKNFRVILVISSFQQQLEAQRNDRMIFVSSTLRGAFGKAWRLAVGPTKKSKKRPWRRRLFEDFAERPIFSVGDLVGNLMTPFWWSKWM